MGVGMFSAALALISEGAELKPPLNPVGSIQRNTSSGSLEVGSRANVVIRLKRARANVVMLGAQRRECWNFNRYLMGLMVTPGSCRPSSRRAIHHLYCLLFSPRFSRVRWRSASITSRSFCPELKLFSLTVFLKVL